MSNHWNTRDAEYHIALREFWGALPHCPNCGAPGTCDAIETTIFGGPITFIHGDGEVLKCTAECWRVDPQRYLAAVKSHQSVKAESS